MFSIERNFVIVFLVVFLNIDQGIYCPDSNDYFSQYKERPAYSQGSFSPQETGISRDNITERRPMIVLPKRLFQWRSMPSSSPLTDDVPFYLKKFRRIESMDQYSRYIVQNDHVIVYFSSLRNDLECQKTKNALWKLNRKPPYTVIEIYEVNLDENKYTFLQLNIESAPTILLFRKGFDIGKSTGVNVSTEFKIEKLLKKLLQIDNKAEDETEIEPKEDSTKKEESQMETITYYRGGYKITCTNGKCNRVKVSSIKNDNGSNELTEPKQDGCLHIITSLEQYKKYSEGIDYSVIFFSSQHKNDIDDCEGVKHILNTLSNNAVYKKIHIFAVDINDCNDVVKHFEIQSAPSLVSLCMENVIGTLSKDKMLDGNKTDDLIESFFKSLLETEVRANWASEPKMIDNIYNITHLEQYLNYCQNTEYAIVFFTSPDNKEDCDKVKILLKEFITNPIYSYIKIYGVDVKNSKDLSEYFKIKSAPTLRSLHLNKEIYTHGPNYAVQKSFVSNMFTNLISTYVPGQAVIYSICGDCAPKTVKASSTNEADTNKIYNQSNLPPLEREGILLKVNTKEQYDKYVINTEFAVIDFSHKNCAGCVVAYDILKKLMEEVQANQEILLYSVNIFDCPDVASIYKTSLAPTLVFLHMGKQIVKFGAEDSQNESAIQNMFDKLLKLKTST